MAGIAPPAAIEHSDATLAAEGNVAAFERLVREHYADMARLAYVITGDRSLAEDAVQSAWVAAWRQIGTVRSPERVRGWLLTVAANEARQLARRRARVRTAELDPQVADPGRVDPAVGIARLDLARALAAIDPDDRALLAGRYVLGLDAQELGALTGRSASATRTRLSRLIARLRRKLTDD